MIDYIVLAIIALLVILAIYYIYREKRKGRYCMGCSDSGCCSHNCSDSAPKK